MAGGGGGGGGQDHILCHWKYLARLFGNNSLPEYYQLIVDKQQKCFLFLGTSIDPRVLNLTLQNVVACWPLCTQNTGTTRGQ